jgi:hypothetical protein
MKKTNKKMAIWKIMKNPTYKKERSAARLAGWLRFLGNGENGFAPPF